MGAENLRHLGRCAGSVVCSGSYRATGRVVWLARACDDLRLVGLKLIFLIVTRVVCLLGLSRREA